MASEKIQQLVAQAVGQQFEHWALQHPALAAVIDRVVLTDQVATSLRATSEYKQAVEDYHRDMNDLNLLSQLLQLAGPILAGILAA